MTVVLNGGNRCADVAFRLVLSHFLLHFFTQFNISCVTRSPSLLYLVKYLCQEDKIKKIYIFKKKTRLHEKTSTETMSTMKKLHEIFLNEP